MPGNRNLLTRHVITKKVNLQGNKAIYFHESRLIYFKAGFSNLSFLGRRQFMFKLEKISTSLTML